MTLNQQKARLASLEADVAMDAAIDQLHAKRESLSHHFKYADEYVEADLDQVRRQRKRLRRHPTSHVTRRAPAASHNRGFTTAQALAGRGGAELQATVRAVMASGMISYNNAARREYRVLTGREPR
jgi:hypothetical protein